MAGILDSVSAGLGEYLSVALLLVRLVVGFIFITAARNKLKDVPQFAADNGLPTPVGYGLVAAELAAGIGFILGVLPQVAAAVVMATMVGSISFHVFKWKSPYWAASGGWEYDLMIFAMASVVLVAGGGSVALFASL